MPMPGFPPDSVRRSSPLAVPGRLRDHSPGFARAPSIGGEKKGSETSDGDASTGDGGSDTQPGDATVASPSSPSPRDEDALKPPACADTADDLFPPCQPGCPSPCLGEEHGADARLDAVPCSSLAAGPYGPSQDLRGTGEGGQAQAKRLREFFIALALCHTVIPEKFEDSDEVRASVKLAAVSMTRAKRRALPPLFPPPTPSCLLLYAPP